LTIVWFTNFTSTLDVPELLKALEKIDPNSLRNSLLDAIFAFVFAVFVLYFF
jgi:hypothetical protein